MKFLVVALVSLFSITTWANVNYKADTSSNATKYAVFTTVEKLCTLTFRFDYSTTGATLSLVNYKDCEFTEARYIFALKQVLSKLKTVLPKVKITQFAAGEAQPHPLTFSGLELIAKNSISDPEFKRIQKEGERSITINSVFRRLVQSTKAFDHFIQQHKAAGLNLSYDRSEKVSRDKNVKGERIISGAGLIFFKTDK